MTQNARQLLGIHHVTAIAGDPQENVDFYVGVLGLRLVKRSVNQDDPGTYHLFYADAVGSPGTDLTFFAWPGALHGREGAGQATAVSLAIPTTALAYWTKRLTDHDIAFEGPIRRFGEEMIAFSDWHGQALELVAAPDAEFRRWQFWTDGPVPKEFAIRGIHGITLKEAAQHPTVPFLTQQLGFRLSSEATGWKRFAVGRGGSGAWLDLVIAPGASPGRVAVGTIHHVAWRTPDDTEQSMSPSRNSAGGWCCRRGWNRAEPRSSGRCSPFSFLRLPDRRESAFKHSAVPQIPTESLPLYWCPGDSGHIPTRPGTLDGCREVPMRTRMRTDGTAHRGDKR